MCTVFVVSTAVVVVVVVVVVVAVVVAVVVVAGVVVVVGVALRFVVCVLWVCRQEIYNFVVPSFPWPRPFFLRAHRIS